MTAKEAHDILKAHNQWRTCRHVRACGCKMGVPKELTEAMNFAIGVLAKIKQDEPVV